ncbi:OLC1v1002532C1 [Oldenlandia corymbosa var. corymbosa]|uniref:OLC1v1002532C1 n=1 Tax=Oldenlandia corymbosa var. corymbosa TaxID=529605 RepID=A0AAV1D920_OLDCO|nr:OLC1v1002532C1 [Oldenlandia corymbosa var. corymbosa]
MASSTLRLIAVTIFLFIVSTTVLSVHDDELESMLNLLRGRGYNLFSNAISTSDIFYEVLSGDSFTFFAPTDSSLFTLDMTNTASEYISALRCHIIPLRVLFPELRRLPSGSSLPTLVKNHRATVRLENPTSDSFITVDGVRVVLPDLYYSRNIAVHGLRGNLNCASVQDSRSHSPTGNRNAPPPSFNSPAEIGPNLTATGVDTKAPSPSPASSLDDFLNSPVANEGLGKPSPLNFSEYIQSPSPIGGDYQDFSSAEPEPPVGGGLPPSYSPAEPNLPPQISPAYNLWLRPPTSTVSAPSSEAGPAPEFSENDDPMAFPPSAIESQADHMVTTSSELSSLMNGNELSLTEVDELKNKFPDLIPITATEEMAVMMGRTPWEKCEPLDEANFGCAIIDELGHDSVPDAVPAYAFTRESVFANPRTTCCNAANA